MKNISIMRQIIMIIALGSIITLSGCKFFKNHRLFSKDVDTLLDISNQKPLPVIDTMPIIEEPAMPATDIKPTQSSYGYGSSKYYMIVGSFQNQNLAERYARKIQQMGYSTKIIESSNGFYRVSAQTYDNFRQGVNEIDQFRSTVASRAWLHVRK